MLADEHRQCLRQLLAARVRFDEPMARHTSLRVGGPTEALAEPRTEAQLKDLLQWMVKQAIPYTVIGSGTNLLVRDGGIRGVTVRMPAGVQWRTGRHQVLLTAQAGLSTKRLCALALRHGWQGLHFALGIPGSIGGALSMNAGTHLGSMADVVTFVTFMTAQGQIVRLTKDRLRFSYRSLTLPNSLSTASQERPVVLLGAEFALTPGDSAALRRQARAIMQRRVKSQPRGQASAGCFFRNPSPQTSAGRLIDQAGLKGAAVGDAQVSWRHANFIVNKGRATAAEVLRLKELIEATVWQRCGVRLQPEVHIVGHDQDA